MKTLITINVETKLVAKLHKINANISATANKALWTAINTNDIIVLTYKKKERV